LGKLEGQEIEGDREKEIETCSISDFQENGARRHRVLDLTSRSPFRFSTVCLLTIFLISSKALSWKPPSHPYPFASWKNLPSAEQRDEAEKGQVRLNSGIRVLEMRTLDISLVL
jgi:hypothetical protein